MRTISLVAAAAAGMIAPLATGLPLPTGAQVPGLGGLDSVVRHLGGSDNNGGNNGDNDRSGGDHNDGHGRDDGYPPHPHVTAQAAQDSLGNTDILVKADDFTPLSGKLRLTSAALANACRGGLVIANGRTDRYGTALFIVRGQECVPGKYTITIVDQGTPGVAATDEVRIY